MRKQKQWRNVGTLTSARPEPTKKDGTKSTKMWDNFATLTELQAKPCLLVSNIVILNDILISRVKSCG